MSDRWQMYSAATPRVASGWMLDTVTPPSRLGGSNGMTIGPDGRLYVTQVFGSQVTAIDVERGDHEVFCPLGGGIVAPDDGIFGADGTFYATEPFAGRVTARNPDGSYRVVRADLPGANGVTMDHAGRRLFVDEFRPGGRLMELNPDGDGEPRFLMEDLNGPNAPSMGPDGRIHFPQVFANEIWVYDLDAGRGQLRSVTSVCRRRSSSMGEGASSCPSRAPVASPPSTWSPASARPSPRFRRASTTCRWAPATASSSLTT